jgi:Skp family chaperone for outer membrane proteins
MKTLIITISGAVLAAMLAVTVVGRASAPGEPARIAYVSTNRIIAESPDARAEVARFQAAQQQKTTELRAKQRELTVTRQQFGQASSAETRAELARMEEQQRAELERATSQAQTDLQKLQQQMHANLQARLKPILQALAQNQDFQIVLNADTAVVWASPSVDLTAAVIERLNATSTSKPKP